MSIVCDQYRIAELIAHSKELKFLVGFFYFSGIRELYNSLKNNPDIQLDVLVGLNVDKAVHGLSEYSDNTKGLTDKEKFELLLSSISNSRSSEIPCSSTKTFFPDPKCFFQLLVICHYLKANFSHN